MVSVEFQLDTLQQELLEARIQRRFLMRISEESLLGKIEDALSEDALSQIIDKYGICDVHDFCGLNIVTSRLLLSCVIKVLYRYPRLRSKLNFIGSKKGYLSTIDKFIEYDIGVVKKCGVQHICEPKTSKAIGQAIKSLLSESVAEGANTVAQAVYGVGILDAVILDEEDFSTQRFRAIKCELEENVRSRFSPQGCNSISSVIYHEIGHLLDSLCGVSNISRIAEEFKESSLSDIEEALSKYAATSVSEYIAEGFAEAMSNASPRSTAKYILAVINESYQTLDA